MIYTLTANPAIDMNFNTKTADPYKVNRTSDLIYSPNGKGVNVTLTLKNFNIDSTVMGFFGGFTGKYIIDELEKRGVYTNPCIIEENTRINVFFNKDKEEFKFVNNGPYVKEDVQKDMLKKLKCLKKEDMLIVSGSLPYSIKEIFYDEIMKICTEKGVQVILDISSKKLIDLLSYKPLLIKPNDEEIKDIFGIEIITESDVKEVLKMLKEKGAKNILLTMGEKGMYFFDGEKIMFCEAFKVELVSSACAGDAALGAFISEWTTSKNIEVALKKAAALGAEVASSHGLGNFEKYKGYMEDIKVREVIL